MNLALSGTLQRWLTGPRVSGLPQPMELPPPKLSFEFFPPKNEALEQQLWAAIRRLEPLGHQAPTVDLDGMFAHYADLSLAGDDPRYLPDDELYA